ncbi:MAG TPA: hypothetical protein VG820_06210 [Fimbriimonadaceae bacterium]|nr:hypothetical protein [Fimbriimonadaceae bacterium]
MPTDPHHLDPDENELIKLGYETEDIQFKSLGKSIFWFFGFVVFCGVAGVVIFFLFLGGSPAGAWKAMTSPPDNTTPVAKRLPPEPNPLLQTNVTARTDIRDLRRAENEILHGKAAWVDQSKGLARIPIDQAIDLYLSKVAPNASKDTTMTSGAPPVGAAPSDETPSEEK